MRLFDTHAHLDFPQFDPDRDRLIEELVRQGVHVVNVGVDLETSRASLELARAHPHIHAACGVHPHDARDFTDMTLKELAALLARGAVAVGECGLDYYRDLSPREDQRRAFRAQLELARERGIPVIVHLRGGARDELLETLREVNPGRGVIHAFSPAHGSPRDFLDLGFHIGIGGPVTYRKNAALRALLREIPLERLLVETDSPYLPPEPHRGKRNDPAKVRLVVERIAEVLRLPPRDIAELTFRNARALFRIDA
ncbi:MAG: TatD family hydrolase [Caldiserica bacterium]|nr:TatD family hydrolase [Caldisericota bacterium]